jgi:hypothetical protein
MQELHEVAAMIGLCIGELVAAGYRETAALLSIAELDLKARLSGFSDNELAAIAALAGTKPEHREPHTDC